MGLQSGRGQIDVEADTVRDKLRQALEESLANGNLRKACAEENWSVHKRNSSGNPLELFPVVTEMFPEDDAKTHVIQQLLENALNDGTLEEALSTPAVLRSVLPSCPHLS